MAIICYNLDFVTNCIEYLRLVPDSRLAVESIQVLKAMGYTVSDIVDMVKGRRDFSPPTTLKPQEKENKMAPTKGTTVVPVVEINRHQGKLSIPEGMSIATAIQVLERQAQYEEQSVIIQRNFNCFPWDGAVAFMNAMKKKFGWIDAVPTPGFFGDTPPKNVQVEVGYGKHKTVVWGDFKLPGLEGRLTTTVTRVGVPERTVFRVQGEVKRHYESTIIELLDLTQEYVDSNSIYRGQAVKIRFMDEKGDTLSLPVPQFLDLSKVNPDELVFSKSLEASIDTNLFTPLRHTVACRDARIPLKRGILFAGQYGVGKSLAAHVTAKIATDNNWTYLYCERADELKYMVSFAHQYQPAVVFCEDIDRVTSGERSVKIDDILNVIDGIESKGTELIIVLTTNHVDRINKAMLRPGRLDAIITVEPPDAEAVYRLVTKYSGSRLLVRTEEDHRQLMNVCALLAGKVPAAIRECVERAKLSAIKLTDGEDDSITPAALADSANSMSTQLQVMQPDAQLNMVLQTRRDVIEAVTRKAVEYFMPSVSDILPVGYSPAYDAMYTGEAANKTLRA